MAAIDKLTEIDRTNLRKFASAANCGIRWKGKLRDFWSTGYCSVNVDRDVRSDLLFLRNRLGTSWLSKFKFA